VPVRAVRVALSRARANKTCSVYGMARNIYHIRAKRANVLFCLKRPSTIIMSCDGGAGKQDRRPRRPAALARMTRYLPRFPRSRANSGAGRNSLARPAPRCEPQFLRGASP
jgi:hypothetical protein